MAAPWLGSARAASFPDRPITLICPSVAGGGADQHMRMLAAAAGRHLPQPIVVENRAGGGGVLGPASMLANARADGYTLCQLMIAIFRAPHTQKVSFDPLTDFSYIIHVSGYLFGAFARSDSPHATMPEVMEFARANPGKLTYGSAGPGSTHHVIFEQVLRQAGVTATHVPFRGEAEIFNAVLGGHVMVGVATGALGPLVDAGRVRWLHTYSRQRTARWPQVPTAREEGFGIVSESPYGIGAPKGLDLEIVRLLHDAFKAGMAEPDHRAFLERQVQPNLYLDSAAYAAYAAELYREQGELMRLIGLARKD